MPFEAEFSKKFLKNVKKLPNDVRARILKALLQILEDPRRGTALVGNLKGLWRWRVGNYRIIYMIKSEEELVCFVNMDKRERIY
jgi:mRNA interferase RelE/StbE